MPTGYTASINENKGTTFAEFVWHCSRNFGAMYHLRDDASGVPTLAQAMSDASSTSWHASKLEEAQAHLQAVLNMTPESMDAQRVADCDKAWESFRRRVSEKNLLRERYQAMLNQVKAWTPPTADHDNLRKFMIEQLEESMRFDCYDPEPPKNLDLDAYRVAQIDSATWSVNYHAKELARSREVEAQRRAWIDALHASVPNPRE